VDWISVEDEMPDLQKKVLIWKGGENVDYGISFLDDLGLWSGMPDGSSPTHWMPLPGAPEAAGGVTLPQSVTGKIADGCVMFRLDEDKETIAALMHHYITGEPARIQGGLYYVTDMKNGISDSHVVTTFLLKPLREQG